MRDERLTLSERVNRLESIATRSGYDLGDFTVPAGENAEPDYNDAGKHQRMDWQPDRFMSRQSEHISKVNAPPEPTSFEEIIQRVQSASDRVLTRAHKLEEIGNRILGNLPETDSSRVPGDKAAPEGTLEHTHMALNMLDCAMSRLEFAADRLERI